MKRHIETKVDGEHLTTLKNLIDILDSGESADVSLKRAALIKINLLIQVDILIRLLATAFLLSWHILVLYFFSNKNFIKITM
jgi:hypothetical protein